MTETLDILPGEGDVETIIRKRVRKDCEYCDEPAHYKCSYLLPNCRSNPASKAYRHDDCSYCSDYDLYLCKKCYSKYNGWHPSLDGYEPCSLFPANEHFAHMFLTWQIIKE
jgi:hypothetical protein